VVNVNTDLYAGSWFRALKKCIQRRSITGLEALSVQTAYRTLSLTPVARNPLKNAERAAIVSAGSSMNSFAWFED
jgi:hypothetical protein